MSNILLIEPDYKSTYPPLGLMKIAYYHKELRKDFVRFAKGRLIEKDHGIKWDKVYITTLFTFTWAETINAIDYAKSLVDDISKIYIGGIMASLVPSQIETETEIRPITGILDTSNKLGYEDNVNIDLLPLDYSILADAPYHYSYDDCYFAHTTRGCGNKCSFCAVQKLEPFFIERIPIKEQIEKVKVKYGEKRDLILMDNNVLKSTQFDLIVQELVELGYGKGAKFENPKTKKLVNRYVDFNQGLDVLHLTEDKAALLGRLAIKPVRIAFDHIEDEEKYKDAISMCARYGMKHFSNYILYNINKSYGKNKEYNADKPSDLYRRLQVNVELQETLNRDKPQAERIHIYSFPMRYVPLNKKSRGHEGFIGQYWNPKSLRAIQVMCNPAQGKGVSRRGFFEAAFGESEDKFITNLAMPENVLTIRGNLVNNKNETKEQQTKRLSEWNLKQEIWHEWEMLFANLDNKEDFLDVIKDNNHKINIYFNLKDDYKKLYLYYLSQFQFLTLLQSKQLSQEDILYDYCINQFFSYLKYIAYHIYNTELPYSSLTGFINYFKHEGISLLLKLWLEDDCNNNHLIDSLDKAIIRIKNKSEDVSLLKIYKAYLRMNVFSNYTKTLIKKIILKGDYAKLRKKLETEYPVFISNVTKQLEKNVKPFEVPYLLGKIKEDISSKLSVEGN